MPPRADESVIGGADRARRGRCVVDLRHAPGAAMKEGVDAVGRAGRNCGERNREARVFGVVQIVGDVRIEDVDVAPVGEAWVYVEDRFALRSHLSLAGSSGFIDASIGGGAGACCTSLGS